MRVDLQLGAGLSAVGRQALDFRAAGVAGGFTYEGRTDPFLPLAVAGASGADLDLYTNVAVGMPRNAMVLAYQAWDLQRLTGGRFALGLGSQVRAHVVGRFGTVWERPVAQMRELIDSVRAIHGCWQHGTPLAFEGAWRRHTLMPPLFDPGPLPEGPPAILGAAVGPAMTTMVAEAADGLTTHPFSTAHYFNEHTLPLVDAGLARAGRSRDDFRIVAGVIVQVWGDEAQRDASERACRALLGFYGSTPAYRPVLESHGWSEIHNELRARARDGRWDELGELWDEEMLDTLTVRGGPSEVADQLRLRFAGVADRVALSMPYGADLGLVAEIIDSIGDQ